MVSPVRYTSRNKTGRRSLTARAKTAGANRPSSTATAKRVMKSSSTDGYSKPGIYVGPNQFGDE